MTSRLAIYHPGAAVALGQNPFGKDVANLAFFSALARHGGFEQLDILTHGDIPAEVLAQGLLGGASTDTRITSSNILWQRVAADAGALFRGKAELADLAWLRRQTVGDRGYSLIGLIHTIAPPAVREYIGAAAIAPVQPWDALICTSPSVQEAMVRMFDEWGDYLGARTGGARPPRPSLPLLPLGVDQARFEGFASRPPARAALRERLGVGPDDALVIWVGRLSYFEKAFPQPMFRVVQEAARLSGVRTHFALAGWFPGGEAHRTLYQQAASLYAPDVPTHFLDGNDPSLLADLWAAADVFLSLVDNVQETFGIAPVEAMAAGLPVVISDWDGYRYTVRDGVEGALVPTLLGPAGKSGRAFSARHTLLMDSYQSYVGLIAQHTAVHISHGANALAALLRDPELRRKMGEAGRQRVRTTFDWPVVVAGFRDLLNELHALRRASADQPTQPRSNPLKGDPFRDFAGFATGTLEPTTQFRLRSEANPQPVGQPPDIDLNAFGRVWRGTADEQAKVLNILADGSAKTVSDILSQFPGPRQQSVELSLIWMAKLGVLDWISDAPLLA